jgi:hypothetical protein
LSLSPWISSQVSELVDFDSSFEPVYTLNVGEWVVFVLKDPEAKKLIVQATRSLERTKNQTFFLTQLSLPEGLQLLIDQRHSSF